MVNSTCSSALEVVIAISLSYAMVTKDGELGEGSQGGRVYMINRD